MGGIFGSNQTQTTNNNQQYSGQSTGDFSRTGTNSASYNPYGSPFLTNALNFAQPGIMSATGAASPYFSAASNLFGMAGQGPNVSQFFNPYASAITSNLKDLFGQQMSQLTGSLTQQAGGVGADRIAVGQSELAKQQGQVEAGALEQAYAPALQAALQQEYAQNQAGFGYAGLGSQAQAAALAPYQTLGNVTAQLAPQLGGTNTGQQTQSGTQSQNTSGTQTGQQTSQTQYNPSIMSDIGSIMSAVGGFGGMGGLGGGGGGFTNPFAGGFNPIGGMTGNYFPGNPAAAGAGATYVPGYGYAPSFKRGGAIDPHLEALADLHDSPHLRKLARGGAAYADGGSLNPDNWTGFAYDDGSASGTFASPFAYAPTGTGNPAAPMPMPRPRPDMAPQPPTSAPANPYAAATTVPAQNPYAYTPQHQDTGGFFPGLMAAGAALQGHPDIAAQMVRGRQSIEQAALQLDQQARFHADELAHQQQTLAQAQRFHDTPTAMQQFEMSKPVPIGQQFDPNTGLPMTTYATRDAQGNWTPLRQADSPEANDASPVRQISKAMQNGEQPPTFTGLYKYGPMVRADLARNGFDLSKAQLEWKAAEKQVLSLNAPQMVRFVGLAQSVDNTINEANTLAGQMKNSGIPILNRAKLTELMQLEGNSPRGQLATRYLTTINTLKEEYANLAQGGYAPTEPAWKLSEQIINGDYGVDQLGSALTEAQRLIRYRLHQIPNMDALGPGAGNRFVPGAGAGAGSTPPVTGAPDRAAVEAEMRRRGLLQ